MVTQVLLKALCEVMRLPSTSRKCKQSRLLEAERCPMRGCRAPEFATGEVLQMLKQRMPFGWLKA